MIVFSMLFLLVAVALVTTTVMNGFNELNLHLSCYGLILLCIGYLIDVSRKQKVSSISDQVEWIMDKKYGSLAEELKGLRTLVLSLEERRLTGGGGNGAKKEAVPNVEVTRRRIELELDKLPKYTKNASSQAES